MISDRLMLLFLNACGWTSQKVLIALGAFNPLEDILKASEVDLKFSGLFTKGEINKLLAFKLKSSPEAEAQRVQDAGASFVSILDDAYPAQLKTIDDPPALLYIKGSLDFKGLPPVAIVGSRKCSDYGVSVCEMLAQGLAGQGVPIVSGLAAGIDGIAHRAAIRVGGYTVGVLGTGIDRIYPPSNRGLFYDMERRGGIVTEFPLGAQGLRHHFPMRNRIISGLSHGVVVIEAKKASGTLITAGLCGDQGRSIMAVPGNITSLYSQGTNALINDGARLIQSVEDVLDEIGWTQLVQKKTKNRDLDLTESQMTVYNCLEYSKTPQEISDQTGLTIPDVQSILTILELMGHIHEAGAQRFARTL